MFKKLREFFERAWKYIQALWEKHDDQLEEMVEALLPMVIDVAFRPDLSGEDKKKAIVDMVVDNAEATAGQIATSMLNEAVEIAARMSAHHACAVLLAALPSPGSPGAGSPRPAAYIPFPAGLGEMDFCLRRRGGDNPGGSGSTGVRAPRY